MYTIKLGKKESYYNRKLWKLYIYKKKEILSTINISFQLFPTTLTILIHLHVITFQCTYQYTRISYKFKINFKDNWKRISNWSFLFQLTPINSVNLTILRQFFLPISNRYSSSIDSLFPPNHNKIMIKSLLFQSL